MLLLLLQFGRLLSQMLLWLCYAWFHINKNIHTQYVCEHCAMCIIDVYIMWNAKRTVCVASISSMRQWNEMVLNDITKINNNKTTTKTEKNATQIHTLINITQALCAQRKKKLHSLIFFITLFTTLLIYQYLPLSH